MRTIINQSELTDECWLIQMFGISSCNICEVRGTKKCGGKQILKSFKNEKGFNIPLKNRGV
jgi:hypothetical protein